MRLIVKKPGTRYAGQSYAVGDEFEVDPSGHNVASHVRFLKAVGRVADAPPLAPVRQVATTAPAPEPAKEEDPPAVTEETEAPRRGRYQRRDLRSED